jgi:hypothetical protein
MAFFERVRDFFEQFLPRRRDLDEHHPAIASGFESVIADARG